MNPINSLTLKVVLDKIERCKSTKNGFMDLYGLYITLFKLYISRPKNYCKKSKGFLRVWFLCQSCRRAPVCRRLV